jgi:hypothetical protein
VVLGGGLIAALGSPAERHSMLPGVAEGQFQPPLAIPATLSQGRRKYRA